MPTGFFGFDHADIRVASLVAVERFYDALMPELGLPVKTYAFVDAAGDWHEPDDAHPYNTVEYHETLVPGEPERFVGFIENPGMRPTSTRLAFRVASVAEVVRWRARLLQLGAHRSRSATISTTTRPCFSAIRPARYSKSARGRRSLKYARES